MAEDKKGETKSERFERLANFRVQKAIGRIRQVSQLSKRAQYEYDREQAMAILTALQNAVSGCADAFFPERVKQQPFELPKPPTLRDDERHEEGSGR